MTIDDEMENFRDWMDQHTTLKDSSRDMYAKYVSRLDTPLDFQEDDLQDTLHLLKGHITTQPVKSAFKKYLQFKEQSETYSIDAIKNIDFVRNRIDGWDVKTGDGLSKEEIIAKYLNLEEVEDLQQHITQNYAASNFQSMPDPERFCHEFYLLPLFLLETACRINEALNIRVSDIDFDERKIKIRYGKGGKFRMVNVDKSYTRIQTLINTFDVDGELFAFDRDDHYWKLRYELIKCGNTLYDRDVTPHWFRHSFATNWAIKRLTDGLGKGDIKEEIRDYLDHEDTKTTEEYIHAAQELEQKNIFTEHGGCDSD